MKTIDLMLAGWFATLTVVAFLAFGYDKWRARREGERVSEARLLWLSALGGWLGGLLGMMVFRHKTAKWSFKLKFAAALLPVGVGIFLRFYWR